MDGPAQDTVVARGGIGMIRLQDDLRAAERLLAMLAVLTAIFCVGRLDRGVSALFYQPGVGFTWDKHGLLEFVRTSGPTLILASLLVVTLAGIAGLLLRAPVGNISARSIVYLLATVVIGPGLVCEALLKPHWGRARPKDLTLFGGHAAYTPPFAVAHECTGNCSFVSGHAAIAFWVTAYAFLLPVRWRPWGLLAGVMFGLAVGLVRVMQGGHFASDVAAAGLIVVGMNLALARVFFARR